MYGQGTGWPDGVPSARHTGIEDRGNTSVDRRSPPMSRAGRRARLAEMNGEQASGGARVVIAGGGVAGIETLLALDDLAGDQVAQTLVSPTPDFLYKPRLVEEPFDIGPAERYELQPLAEEKGASFVQHAVSTVRPADHAVELDNGTTLGYDYLVVCAGGRFVPA